MKWVETKWLSAAIVGQFLIIGCGAPSDDTGSAGADIVVEAPALADYVTVKDDRLEFNSKARAILESGSILAKLDAWAAAKDKTKIEPVIFVGKRGSDAKATGGVLNPNAKNPLGYLRRGLSYSKTSDGGIVVMTEPSDLTEAAAELQKNGFFELHPSTVTPIPSDDSDDPNDPNSADPNDPNSTDPNATDPNATDPNTTDPNTPDPNAAAAASTSTASSCTTTTAATESSSSTQSSPQGLNYAFSLLHIDKSGTNLWKAGDSATSMDAQLNLKTATLDITPTISGSFQPGSSRWHPNGSLAIASSIDAALEFQIITDGQRSFSAQGPLPSPPPLVGAIGAIPVTLTLALSWSCGVQVDAQASATVGAKAHITVNPIGASWQGASITPHAAAPTFSYETIPPTLSASVTVTGECHVIANLSLQVFDIIGPHASVDLSTKMDQSENVLVGGDLTFGLALSPFGVKVKDFTAPPIHFGPSDPIAKLSVGGLLGTAATQ